MSDTHVSSDYAHAEDGCATADIEHDLVLEEVFAVVDSVSVASRSYFVFLKLVNVARSTLRTTYQHLFVNACIVSEIL